MSLRYVNGVLTEVPDTNVTVAGTENWTPEMWQQFGATGGTISDTNTLNFGTPSASSGIKDYLGLTGDNVLGLSSSQWTGLGTLGGLAAKALALPSQMDYYNTQTAAAKQQIANTAQSEADRKAFNQKWASASNGLAASSLV